MSCGRCTNLLTAAPGAYLEMVYKRSCYQPRVALIAEDLNSRKILASTAVIYVGEERRSFIFTASYLQVYSSVLVKRVQILGLRLLYSEYT